MNDHPQILCSTVTGIGVRGRNGNDSGRRQYFRLFEKKNMKIWPLTKGIFVWRMVLRSKGFGCLNRGWVSGQLVMSCPLSGLGPPPPLHNLLANYSCFSKKCLPAA